MTATMTDEALEQQMAIWRKDPMRFMVEALDVKPEYVWDKMIEVAESVRDNPRTAVGAGHCVSKTFTAPRIAEWFLYCFKPATVITTAPTHEQVEDQFWRELRESHNNARFPLGGSLTRTRLDLQAETGIRWFAKGFSTKPETVTGEATAFQGYHNENVLVIFDEAAGILPQIWNAAQHLLTSEGGMMRWLVQGNPTADRGEFVDAISGKHGWHPINISVLDTPNYKENRVVIPGLSGRTYERQIREKYGEDSNEYRVRILGLPPPLGEGYNQLISDAWIAKAVLADPYMSGKVIACDPARFGDDEAVILALKGTEIVEKVSYRKSRTTTLSSKIHELSRQMDNCPCVVDEIGIGAGVVDELIQLGRKTIGFNSSAKPTAGLTTSEGWPVFYNLRAEAWWTAARMFAEGDVCCRNMYPELRQELCIPTYYYRLGKVLVEPKEDIKERIGKSPDHADCYIMGVYTIKQMSQGGNMQAEDVQRLRARYGPPVGVQ